MATALPADAPRLGRRHKLQGAWLEALAEAHPDWEVPMKAVRNLTRAWTMATVGCWDAYDHYMGIVQDVLESANES